MRHLWAALSDWQVWLHILVYMSIIAPRMSFRSTFVCTPPRAYAALRQCTESRYSYRKYRALLYVMPSVLIERIAHPARSLTGTLKVPTREE